MGLIELKRRMIIITPVLTFLAGVLAVVIKNANIIYSLPFFFFSLVFVLFLLRRSKEDKNSIKKHILFNKIEHYMSVRIPHLTIINDELKTILVKKTLFLQFSIFKKHALELIENDFKDVLSISDRILVATEELWALNNIPEIFIKKHYELMGKLQFKSLKDYIEFVYTSGFYNDYSRKVAILDEILHVLHWTLIDAERVMQNMNGEITHKLKQLRKENKL